MVGRQDRSRRRMLPCHGTNESSRVVDLRHGRNRGLGQLVRGRADVQTAAHGASGETGLPLGGRAHEGAPGRDELSRRSRALGLRNRRRQQ